MDVVPTKARLLFQIKIQYHDKLSVRRIFIYMETKIVLLQW